MGYFSHDLLEDKEAKLTTVPKADFQTLLQNTVPQCSTEIR